MESTNKVFDAGFEPRPFVVASTSDSLYQDTSGNFQIPVEHLTSRYTVHTATQKISGETPLVSAPLSLYSYLVFSTMYRKFFKRALDVTVAVIGLTITSPVFILVTLILYSSNNGKPFFTQRRPGRHERVFSILKFKTMTDDTDALGNLLPEAQRTTAIGNFLRKSSIDEIPQLINVLKGDMSLIGPRPLRTHYLPWYTETERIRHSVRPGITGLAQVSGRNALSWDDRLELDVQYVRNLSFMQDLNILLKTAKKLVAPEQVVFDPNMLDLDQLRRGDKVETGISTHMNGYEPLTITPKQDILDERPLNT